MIQQIVDMIIAEAKRTEGQDAAARLHGVLMEVSNAVGRVIAAEQKKERESRPDGA